MITSPKPHSAPHWWPTAFIVALAAVGSCLIWYGTYWGPWAYSDGVGYIVNARNLVLGRGLGLYRASGDFILLVTHPPLYPWLLAGLGKAGMDLVAAARWIDVVLFGGFVFAGGWGFWRVTGAAWLAVGLASVLLVQPAFLLAYLSAMSEPVFLLCIVSSLLLMANYILTGKRGYLVLSAGAAAGALLTRYPGAAVIVACVAGLWLLNRSGWREKARDSLMFSAVSISPTLGFVLWTRFVLDARNPRGVKSSFDLVALVTNFTRRALDAVWNWKPLPPDVIPNQLLPSTVTRPLVAVLAVALAAGLGWSVLAAVRSRRQHPPASRGQLEWRPAGLFALFLASYLVFFFAAYLLTYPTPDVDARTLLPLLPGGLLMVFALLDILRQSTPPTRLLSTLGLVALVGSLYGWSVISQDTVLGMHRTGLGYTSRAWQSSETIKAIHELSTDLTLVSNETSAVLLYTDRSAYEIPGLKAGDSQPISVPFGSGSADLDEAFRDGRAALVLFDSVKGQLKSGPGAGLGLVPGDLTDGLTSIFEGNDGAIYCQCAFENPLTRQDVWMSVIP